MAKLEENHSGKAKLLESLQSELSSVQTQQNRVELEVGGRRDSLTADERQLRVRTVSLTVGQYIFHCWFNGHSFMQAEVQEKVSVVNSISDRINLLERKLEVGMAIMF